MTEPGCALLRTRPSVPIETPAQTSACIPSRADDRERVEHVIRSELARYEPSRLSKLGIQRVWLCETNSDGKLIATLKTESALTVSTQKAIYDLVFLRKSLHATLYKILMSSAPAVDPEWDSLNMPDFRYGEPRSQAKTLGLAAGSWEAPTGISGLITWAATQSARDDQAEIYAFSVYEPKLIQDRLRYDRILGPKLELLRRRLDAYPDLQKLLRVDHKL